MLRPLHVHGVSTPEGYRALQTAALAALATRHLRRAAQPWICLAPRTVYVAMGKWLLRCVCGNAPAVDPEWRLACCLECGAIFEHVDVPDDWRAIEAALHKRPATRTQAWVPGETVADLEAENAAHGVA